MTSVDTTRGALRRDGEAIPGACAHPDLDEAIGRLLGSTEAAPPDPVYALIDEHRAAYAEWDRLSKVWNEMMPGSPGYAEAVAACDGPARREGDALDALLAAQPTTLAGLLTLTEYLPDTLRKVDPDPDVPDGEKALRSVAAALRQLARASLPDRGLSALMTHRLDSAEAWLHSMRQDGYVPFPAEQPRTLMAIDLAIPREAERLLRLAQGDIERRSAAYDGLDPDERERVLVQIRASYPINELAAAARGPALALTEPSLFDQIITCWREWGALPNFDETDQGKANFARMDARRSALLDAAEALPATLDNLLPKALALAWLQYVDQWHNGDPREEYGTDGRLAVDIDTAICGRFKAWYARAEA